MRDECKIKEMARADACNMKVVHGCLYLEMSILKRPNSSPTFSGLVVYRRFSNRQGCKRHRYASFLIDRIKLYKDYRPWLTIASTQRPHSAPPTPFCTFS